MLKNIKISEMLKTRWIKKQSPTIEAAGKKVNQLAYWIAYQAISPNSPKKRAAILTHIIKIARVSSVLTPEIRFTLASFALVGTVLSNIIMLLFSALMMFPATSFDTFLFISDH
jgi:hypothetical protein